MFSYIQIFLCFVSICYVSSRPIFGEIGFKKNFDIIFKPPPLPPPFKPFEIIKEIVTPFGKFGMKHVLGKRDLDQVKTIEEDEETPSRELGDRYEVIEPGAGPERFPHPPPPEPVKPPVPQVRPVPIEGPGLGPQLFYPARPIPAPPRPPVVITPPPPKEPPAGLNTNIARNDLIEQYLKSVIPREEVIPIIGNHISSEPKPKGEAPPPEEPPNPIVRGSRLALYFGNILLDVLSQVIGGVRPGFMDRPITI